MKELLLKRTKKLGIEIIKLVDELPNKPSGWIIGKQILRCGTSVGANYRAVCIAKSTPDFINKLKIVEEECDETLFWLEVIEESGIMPSDRLTSLKKEAEELTFIFISSLKTLKSKSLNQNCKSSNCKL